MKSVYLYKIPLAKWIIPCAICCMAGVFSQAVYGSDALQAQPNRIIKSFNIFNKDELSSGIAAWVTQNILNPNIGNSSTDDELSKIAGAIENYLRSLGYLVVKASVTPSSVDGDQIAVSITISKYDKVLVRKQPPLVLSDATLLKELGSNKSGSYIMKSSLERASVILNDLAGVDNKMTLTASGSDGKSNLNIDLSVKNSKGATGSVVYNNYGSSQTGQGGISGNWSFNNLTGHGDVLTVRGMTSVGRMRNMGADYSTPGSAQGSRLKLEALHTDYQIGGAFAVLQSNGFSDTYGLTMDYSLRRTRERNDYFSIGGKYAAISDSVAGSTNEKSLMYGEIALHGDSTDTRFGGGNNNYSLQYTGGTLNLATEAAKATDASTLKAAGGFSKLNASFSRKQKVDKASSWTIAVSGQLSDKNLDSSQKFSIGGPQGVKAYVADAASGDQGYMVNSEIRWIVPMLAETSGVFQFSIFADSGMVQPDRYPVSGSSSTNQIILQDVGAGAAWGLPGNILLKLDYACAVGPGAEKPSPEKGRFWVMVTKYF